MSSMFPRVAFLVLASVALSSLAGRADAVEVLRTQGDSTVNTSVDVAPPETTLDAGDYYVFDGQRVPLLRSEEVVGVRFAAGVSKSTVDDSVQALGWEIEISGETSMRGIAIVRIAKTTASKSGNASGSPAADALVALNALPEVSFAFPVLVNPTTRNRLLLTDEIVARLLPETETADLAAEFDLVLVERLRATREEYVLCLRDSKRQDPLAVANAVSESGLVVWAEPNFVQEFTHFATPNDPLFPDQWHLDNTGQGGGTTDADVDAPEAWDITTGSSSIAVAIIDDGVEKTHEDLSARIYVNPGEVADDGIDNDANGYVDDVSGWDFSNNDADASPRTSDDNHGTAVAGLAAATGNNSLGVSGVCPDCRILPIKIFDGSTFAGSATVANAIRYAAGIADVLSNSWGGGVASSAIQSAIQWATTNGRGGLGAPTFFASGNSASSYIRFTITGVPAGTHRFRWQYTKDPYLSANEDTAWLGWAEFPGGERADFESGGLPAGFTTGGDASWSVSLDRTHADEGRCLTYSARAGTITGNQATYVDAVKTVPAGSLRYSGWVSSEPYYDHFAFWFDENNDGTWSGPYLRFSGFPWLTTDVSYPAAHPESIAIGASTDFDCRAAYSQYGTALDLVAPSSGGSSSITTTDRTGGEGYDWLESYTSSFGGTSAATPIAAGVAGLLLSRNPNLTEGEVRQHLKDTADKVGLDAYDVDGRNDRYGFGRVNADAALQAVPSPCTGSLDLPSASFGAGGGSGSVDVSASCDWTAASNAAWITVTSGASGSGNGSVGYSVASNTGFQRSGVIGIAGQTFTVTQAGPCTATLTPSSASFTAADGAGTFDVSAAGGCDRTAASDVSWIVITSGSNGSGNGSVEYSVAMNTAGPRSGTITAANQTFTVNQTGAVFTSVDAGLQALGGVRAAWGDYDNDGDADLLMNGCSLRLEKFCYDRNTILYRNEGAGVFTAVTTAMEDVQGGSIAWGDYDNDGDLDVFLSGCDWLWPEGCSFDFASIYRNDGAAIFTDISPALPDISAESEWGDYDNDGDLDLLFGSSVYRNDAGSFVSVWTGPETAGAWGDYDNDGDLDLAFSGNSQSRIYRNDGSSNFAEETRSSLLGMSDAYPRWGDYDNDGDLDLLLGGDAGLLGDVTKLYRNDGAGVFTDVAAGLPGAGTDAYYNTWADLDNDGDLDLLLGGLTLYRNDGGGIFVSTGSFSQAVSACSDFDNDGDTDLVGSDPFSGTFLFRNDATTANTVPGAPTGLVSVGGSLVWSPSTDTETPAAGLTYNLRVGTTPGGSDIVSPMASAAGYRRVFSMGGANHGTSAFLTGLTPATYYWSVQAVDAAFAGGPFATETTFSVCPTAIDPTSATIAGSGSGSVSVSAAPGCAWAATSPATWLTVTGGATGNGDGTVTYSVSPDTGASARSGTIFIGDQIFTLNQTLCPTAIDPASANFGLSGGPGSVSVSATTGCAWAATSAAPWITVTGGAAGDGNGTVTYSVAPNTDAARSGWIFIGDQASVVYQGGLGGFSAEIETGLTGVTDSSVSWGDYDNDGDLDILLTGYSSSGSISQVYRNDGGGSFTDIGAGLIGAYHSSVAWGDYDNDGDLDILLSGYFSAAKVYRNDGGDAFTDIGVVLPEVGESSVAWGDYDNDGDLDILLTGRTGSITGVSNVYRNDGGGVFTDIGAGLIAVYNSSVAWGDYDNDGDLDILLAGEVSSRYVSEVYRNDGGGAFTEIGAGLIGVSESSVGWGDYDNDGDLDILLTGTWRLGIVIMGPVSKVYRNDGSGTFTDIHAGLTDVEDSSVAWGDYDNDGDLDILLTGNASSGRISTVYRNDGGGSFTDIGAGLTGVDDGSVAWGDYDNDGDLDILLTGDTDSGRVSTLYRNNSPVANSVPDPPTGIGASTNWEGAALSWQAPNDGQTPSVGLTYNLRVGTTPGGGDIVSPMASPTGYRRVAQLGNVHQATTGVLRSLAAGTYYWSVQAIDTAFAGSAFSAESTFTYTPPTLSIDDVAVIEGDSGTVNAVFTVSLAPASGQEVTVDYITTDGTAAAGSDYVATSGTLVFGAGVRTQPVTVAVNGDTDGEFDETFTVNLSNPSNASISDSEGLGTITSDEDPPVLSIDDVTVTEGDAGTVGAIFTVSLSAASGQEVTVDYATADGTAAAGSDYVAVSGPLTFTAGATTRNVTVTVNGDTLDELDETFLVNLSNATNATISDSQGQCTITDDDAAPALSVDDVTVTEGDSGTVNAVFTVSLSVAVSQVVTVQYTTANGTATAGSDYVATSGTLTFGPGTTTRNITVLVNGDILEETRETFFVNLSNPTNAAISDGQGQGTIRNDDPDEIFADGFETGDTTAWSATRGGG